MAFQLTAQQAQAKQEIEAAVQAHIANPTAATAGTILDLLGPLLQQLMAAMGPMLVSIVTSLLTKWLTPKVTPVVPPKPTGL